MTPEAQRIAIATACGWTNIPPAWAKSTVGASCWWYKDGRAIKTTQLPNYLNDLNAMHEAEDTIKGPLYQRYYSNLARTLPAVDSNTARFVLEICSATAAQRAEAFLRTLNLWTE